MITLQQLNKKIRAELTASRGKETLALSQLNGRILAEDVNAQVAIPAADVSAMDGYAFCGGHSGITENTTLQLIGESIAGKPFADEVQAGQCVRIMTGAVIPKGADSVEMQEYVTANGNQITFNRHAKPHNNIRYCGEEIKVGEVVLTAGKRLQAADILLAASVGRESMAVYQPLKVAVFSTGDELTPPGQALTAGQIYDSNRAMICSLLADFPVEIKDFGLIKDDLSAITTTLKQAAESCDVVITSGGVSVGDYDFLKTAVESVGEIRQYKINMKPGKPFVYGKIASAWYFGLPGNPVSGFVCFQQVVASALWRLAGGEAPPLLSFSVPLSAPLRKQKGRQDFQRGLLTQENGSWQVAPQGKQDSHRIYGLARANCFVVLSAEEEDKKAGDLVTVIPFPNCFAMGGMYE